MEEYNVIQFIYPSTREEEGGEVFHKQINSMKDAVYSAVFQSLVRRVDDKRATMVVRYYISGGLGRAGLRGWPSVEASWEGTSAVMVKAQEISFLYERSTRFVISKKKLCHSRG